jgi:hypothetical protein
MDKLQTKGYGCAQCSCGHVSFEIIGEPLFRGYCHCTICQEFNQTDFADICLYRAKDIVMPENCKVEYKTYASPAMVYRGKCVLCKQPAVEYISSPLMPTLVIVPSSNIKDQDVLPSSLLHIFYHSRVRGVEDLLPKYEGYLTSQFALFRCLIRGYFSRQT